MSGKYQLGFKPDKDAGEGDHGSEGDVEFFVAGGDAAVRLEAAEEILDAVTFVIEMLVKVGFGGTIGLRGYDGDSAELIHKSADRVAVIPFVHDGEGVWLKVRFEQGFGLIKVGDVGPGDDEPQRVAERVAGQMNLGGQAGA